MTGKPSQATLLVDLARDAGLELFHGDDDGAYCRIPRGTHNETWRLRSKPAKRWLARLFYERHGTTPGAQATQDALQVLDGLAHFEGELHDVHLRLAGHEGRIYLDLADEFWQVVEITAEGWEVVEAAPVVFRRPHGMLPLPAPKPGGQLDELREFVNVEDADWPLLAGWLVAALRPQGPFPVLPLHGEQGSAKSTTERVLRELIDPNVAPLRSEPRNGRDLAIAANNGWILAYDNLSSVPDWLSDAFCRIATGGGFSTRELYSDTDEILIDVQRPLTMNGIAELAGRPDLLDRAIPLYLPRLRSWRPEDEFWAAFQNARPRILGALLDAVAHALRGLATVEFNNNVRMADFAKWTMAAEPALGLEPGAFMRSYMGNRAEAVEIALEASPLYDPLQTIGIEGFEGSATELLETLAEIATEKAVHSEAWPKTAAVLGADLRRLAPVLRRVEIEIEFPRRARRDRKRLIVIRTGTQNAVHAVHPVHSEATNGPGWTAVDSVDSEIPTGSNDALELERR